MSWRRDYSSPKHRETWTAPSGTVYAIEAERAYAGPLHDLAFNLYKAGVWFDRQVRLLRARKICEHAEESCA